MGTNIIPEFSVGDVVRLNSGSPNLQVAFINDGELTVVWLDEDGKVNRCTLPAACFQLQFKRKGNSCSSE